MGILCRVSGTRVIGYLVRGSRSVLFCKRERGYVAGSESCDLGAELRWGTLFSDSVNQHVPHLPALQGLIVSHIRSRA